MSKSLKIVVGAVLAFVVVVGAAAAFYVTRDSAEDEASLAAIGGPPTTAPGGAAGAARSSADGTWKIQTGDGVFVGYRVHEKLRGLDKEVTGRTPGVAGTMTVAGASITAASFTADMTGLKTDSDQRDNAIRRMGPETEKFPQATMVLAGPLALPAAPVVGQEITVTAPVDLTVHGVTKRVDMPLRASWDGDQIRVATAPGGVRLQFQDFGFGALTVPIATTDDFGFLEVQLLFVPA